MSSNLRPWQDLAIKKSLDWFINIKKDKRFLINAAPGSGKTICASHIAKNLIDLKKIERVIVIAPRSEIVKQWIEEFKTVTGRSMLKVTNLDEDLGLDICSTWNSVKNNLELFQNICNNFKTLIICDEHHHAAVNATWGLSAKNAFDNSEFAIVLTGTPIRSDGNKPVWFSYAEDGSKLTHPQDGTYTLTYGEAVDLNYCRPVFFHRHEGKFSVVLEKGGRTIAISGAKNDLNENDFEDKKIFKSIQKSLDFYTLARSPIYVGKKPDLNSYQSSMLKWGIDKLQQIKNNLPSAGGLVIAPNIPVAEYMAEILEMLTKEKPMLVHSKTKNSDGKIEAFRNSSKDWIVSVAMISEGVDIKRLRVLIYLPHPQTELSFRQAIGRVVRNINESDDSRAYVVMPTHNIFEEYARRVEIEMQGIDIKKDSSMSHKKCPICDNECNLKDKICSFCGHEFFKNKIETYHNDNKENDFEITLNDAARMGGIARGIDVEEEDVRLAEQHAGEIKKAILESGDAKAIEALNKFPEESLVKVYKAMHKMFGEN